MKKTVPYLYILLWLLYYQQDGTILSRIALVILVALSLYYFVYAHTHYRLPSPLMILSIMLLGWTVYGLAPILEGSSFKSVYLSDAQTFLQPYTELKDIYNSILPIFAFYVFSKEKIITEDSIRKWFFLFFAIAIITYVADRASAIENYNMEEVTNNSSYVILSLLTLLPVFWKKPILQYLLLGVCLLLIVVGFKRGAIVAAVLCSLLIIFYSLKVKNTDVRKSPFWRKAAIFLMLVSLVVAAYYGINYLLETNDYFNLRVISTLAGDDSGRGDYYAKLYNHFINESNILVFLFGNGAYGTIRINGNYAHNDWLEFAIDYGFTYVLLYAFYWISVVKMLLKGKKDSITTLMFCLFFVMYFLMTIVSMSYNSITPYAACAFGYALANYSFKDRHKIKGYRIS